MISSQRSGDFERFFDDNVFAGFRGGDRRVEMRAARGSDGNDFDVRVGEERFEVGVGFATEFFREAFGGQRKRVVAGDEFGADFANGAGVKGRDHPATDDTEFFDFHFNFLSKQRF